MTQLTTPCRAALWLARCLVLVVLAPAAADGLEDTAAKVKASVVGIATYQKTRGPPLRFIGTGFAVADGTLIVTNRHVVPSTLDSANLETLVVLAGRGAEPDARSASVVELDPQHDLALLRIGGAPLPALRLGDSGRVREGQALAFTGYPLGVVLGLYPATHRATLAAITPIARPQANARQLNPALINQIRDGGFTVFQLDGTAYPGNSGSPLYDVASGEVLGIVNMVFVKASREAAITSPSGISYAIPGNYIRDLLARQRRP